MPPAFITGCALISPAGSTLTDTFRSCLDARSAAADPALPAPMNRVPLAQLPAMPELDRLQARWPERSAALAVLAAREALRDAGLEPQALAGARTAIVAGTSKAGVLTAIEACRRQTPDLTDGGGAAGAVVAAGGAGDGQAQPPRRDGDSSDPPCLFPWGTPAGVLAALTQQYPVAGPTMSVVAACASGLAALAAGARLIAADEADTVLVVAADATLHPLFVDSFRRLGVLANWRDEPGDACRPFAADRCGFVLSEGAAAAVLQAPRHVDTALSDVAVRVAAWALGSQAGDLVRPGEAHRIQARLCRTMLTRACWRAEQVDLVHAHGTGTLAGDLAETLTVREALGVHAGRTPVISTKPVTGHMLGAAGLAQALLTVRILQTGRIPPTANLRRPDPRCDLDYNPSGPRQADVARAVCLASGFGGTTVALGLQRGR